MIPDFRDVLTELVTARAKFMVVGAHALSAQGTIEGVKVPVLGRSSLIRNKRASGRKKDLGDLEALGDAEP